MDAGADPMTRNAAGETPWDLAQANKALKGSDAYWRLNEARFEAPGRGTRGAQTTGQAPASKADVPASGPGCLIPGYPTPDNPMHLGLPWCPASVDFQARAYALQAAGAWCAIDSGNSATSDQISARHQEINAACDRLAALGVSNCQCPAAVRPWTAPGVQH